jgi:rubrerythrin
VQNLLEAANGELEEWEILYKEFEQVAREEGFPQVAVAFKMIATVERQHEIRYRKLLANIMEETAFTKDEEIEWQCRNCGYVHTGESAPQSCPACLHPQAFFEPMKKNY